MHSRYLFDVSLPTTWTTPFLQSNNMVFDTVTRYYQELQTEDGVNATLPHMVISNMEHDSVDITARKMEEQGKIGKCVLRYYLEGCGPNLSYDVYKGIYLVHNFKFISSVPR